MLSPKVIRRLRDQYGTVPIATSWDRHERVWKPALPYLFQRVHGVSRSAITHSTVGRRLADRCVELAKTHPDFRGVSFAPHDFRRLFATDLVNSGLPIHIGAALLGHLNIQTTRGYVAVFDDDVVRHYQEYLHNRREQRPDEEYRKPSTAEWSDFEEHFDKRKIELGSCARPYGTPCAHEHACVRCPMLTINPKMLPRLDELEDDLRTRRARALSEGWRGEVEGLDLTLTFLRGKRNQARRTLQVAGGQTSTDLGMPTVRA